MTKGAKTHEFAARFVGTYCEHPPLIEHETIVCCNGGPLEFETQALFTPIQNVKFYVRPNDSGWDIGAYQDVAKTSDADMMFCLGESNHFHREGWGKRFVEAWQRYGPGMYGPYSSNAVRAHLNTTAFCTSPKLLRQYSARARNRAERYEFEHGEKSFWRRLAARGAPTKLVTWNGEWDPRLWRYPANILWRGDQSNCLMWCNHSERYATLPASRKRNWEASTNRAFK